MFQEISVQRADLVELNEALRPDKTGQDIDQNIWNLLLDRRNRTGCVWAGLVVTVLQERIASLIGSTLIIGLTKGITNEECRKLLEVTKSKGIEIQGVQKILDQDKQRAWRRVLDAQGSEQVVEELSSREELKGLRTSTFLVKLGNPEPEIHQPDLQAALDGIEEIAGKLDFERVKKALKDEDWRLWRSVVLHRDRYEKLMELIQRCHEKLGDTNLEVKTQTIHFLLTDSGPQANFDLSNQKARQILSMEGETTEMTLAKNVNVPRLAQDLLKGDTLDSWAHIAVPSDGQSNARWLCDALVAGIPELIPYIILARLKADKFDMALELLTEAGPDDAKKVKDDVARRCRTSKFAELLAHSHWYEMVTQEQADNKLVEVVTSLLEACVTLQIDGAEPSRDLDVSGTLGFVLTARPPRLFMAQKLLTLVNARDEMRNAFMTVRADQSGGERLRQQLEENEQTALLEVVAATRKETQFNDVLQNIFSLMRKMGIDIDPTKMTLSLLAEQEQQISLFLDTVCPDRDLTNMAVKYKAEGTESILLQLTNSTSLTTNGLPWERMILGSTAEIGAKNKVLLH